VLPGRQHFWAFSQVDRNLLALPIPCIAQGM